VIVIVMGVEGSGKTTVGTLLARQMGWEFVDADSFHPAANIEKIRKGIALNDADRAPWLHAIHAAVVRWQTEHRNVVLACSALKRAYRQEIVVGPDVALVYLKGSYDLIAQRLRNRHGHFATLPLLASQFASLEEPEEGVTAEVNRSPEEIVAQIRYRLQLRPADGQNHGNEP
jgi:gluconokinase